MSPLAAHGLARYPPDRLYREVAFVAYHFNWAHDDILGLPHWERRRWCDEISHINRQMNEPGDPGTRDIDLGAL